MKFIVSDKRVFLGKHLCTLSCFRIFFNYPLASDTSDSGIGYKHRLTMFEYSLLNLVSVFHFSFQIELDSEQGSEQGSRSRIKTKIVNFD